MERTVQQTIAKIFNAEMAISVVQDANPRIVRYALKHSSVSVEGPARAGPISQYQFAAFMMPSDAVESNIAAYSAYPSSTNDSLGMNRSDAELMQ